MQAAIKDIRKYMVTTHCFYFEKLNLKSFKKALEEILEINPDGVVLAPFFFDTSIDFATELSRRKIPFVFLNIDIELQNSLSYIGQDSYQSGLMSGKLLNLSIDQHDQIAIVRSRKNIGNHHAIDARTQGFHDFFEQHDGKRKIFEVLFEAFEPDEINKVLSQFLSNNRKLKGVFVPSSASFLVARFLESSKQPNIHVVGFDAHPNNLDCLKNGSIDFLIDQDPYEQGFLGIKVLFDYLLFKKLPNKIYNSPINIVTQENAQFFKKTISSEVIT